ncbi:hypothetical protein ACIGFK_13165 [Streptomyces sp. NPDC085524]|uniref:hypothetical protein n=1 Tax=Streptomyces sp. NPDC085524 TaxID=3365728 RepID=UPI0037D53A84
MSASAQSGHSIIDAPATPAACARDFQAAQAERQDPKGNHYVDQLGALGSGQQHTHRR